MTVQTDTLFSALADPTRRTLIEWILEEGSGTATRYADRLPISRQATAKHLVELQQAGVVVGTRSGRETRYSFVPGGLAPASEWLERRERSWTSTLDRLKTAAEAESTN